jgi:hypothetical protein
MSPPSGMRNGVKCARSNLAPRLNRRAVHENAPPRSLPRAPRIDPHGSDGSGEAPDASIDGGGSSNSGNHGGSGSTTNGGGGNGDRAVGSSNGDSGSTGDQSDAGTNVPSGDDAGSSTTPPVPTGPSGTWNLVFEDNFSGSSLDSNYWKTSWYSGTNKVSLSAANVAVSGGRLGLTLSSSSVGAAAVTGPRHRQVRLSCRYTVCVGSTDPVPG